MTRIANAPHLTIYLQMKTPGKFLPGAMHVMVVRIASFLDDRYGLYPAATGVFSLIIAGISSPLGP